MRNFFSISDYISVGQDLSLVRENIEWSNFWYSNSDSSSQQTVRLLLIGDSTARMMRRPLEELSGYPVDLLASTSGFRDVLFQKQVDAFFASDRFLYKSIFVQLGIHNVKNVNGGGGTNLLTIKHIGMI